jgi:hypothetical protein
MKKRDRLKLENEFRPLSDDQLRAMLDASIRMERHHQREAARHAARANVAQSELRKRSNRSTTESTDV